MLTVEQQYGIEESLVSCQVQDKEVQGTPLRLEPESLVFEIHNPEVVLQVSQVIGELVLLHGDAVLYKGRAVVKSLVHTGLRVVCEVKLDSIITRGRLSGVAELSRIFDEDFVRWQRQFHISPEFKVIIADVEDFLLRVRQWLEQREFGYNKADARAAAGRDSELLEAIADRVIRSFNTQHERFEELIYSAPMEFRHMHHAFAGRHWKKLFLGCPFGHRTYHKPLGYAGDYEMMNMIHRNQPEGGSAYDRLLHFLLVSQWPAVAVRNRAAHLRDAILTESARVAGQGRRCQILNIGCGPAREVQSFLEQSPLSNQTEFSFIDFNEETLLHARQRFDALCRQFNRQARLQTRVLSVYQLLKRGMPASGQGAGGSFDVIYCSGLFDYLADETCRSLVRLLFSSLNSQGLMIVGNMKDEKPFRNFIESVLDWHLVYRDTRKMATLAPAAVDASYSVEAEATGVNLFLHVRKCR
jgi:extracellular factor (EF) 3-hydroxypalmitic acid methyl ester biosynthesis protein